MYNANSNVMKSQKSFTMLKTFLAVTAMMLLSVQTFAQFEGSAENNQIPIHEVRKGSAATYSVSDSAVAGEEFRWEVIGGVITTPGASGAGTAASPSVIDFTTDLHTIDVQWQADDNTITSLSGEVAVQKRTTALCPSVIQRLDVDLWSEPTAEIATAGFEICSGDAAGGNITVNFTGAPEFDLTYTVTATDLTDDAGNPITGGGTINGVTTGTTTISLPAVLVSTSSTEDKYYVIELTAMNDDFVGPGSIIGTGTFTITVHPTVETGDITSDNVLQRR